MTPLDKNLLDELLECPISLLEAKGNLLNLGYAIQFDTDSYFSTDYKKSDFESRVGYLTGETIKEYDRKFIVFAGDNGVTFRYKYRVIHHGEKFTSYSNPLFFEEELDNIKKIQKEVCGEQQTVKIQSETEIKTNNTS